MNGSDFDTLDGLPTIRGDDGTESKLLADRYKIIRKLGEGGMGMVYLAEDTELGNTKVAIKFIPPMLAGNVRAVKNLKKEAQTAMQLSHPNIVRLHDLHTDGHQKFLVMEYIEGKTLEEVLAEKEDDRFTLEELLPIAEQVAAGLDFAHSKKVLHRDLKPSNIMVDKNGTVKLLDFGIAREMKDSYTRVTGQETSGTLPYMSPEQLMGEKPTSSMDIYSFAAVLYECLSGHPPFYRGDIQKQIEAKKPDDLIDHPAYINVALQKFLAKDPNERPSDAFTCVLELKQIEQDSLNTVKGVANRVQKRFRTKASKSRKHITDNSHVAVTRATITIGPFVLIVVLLFLLPKFGMDPRGPLLAIVSPVLILLVTLLVPARLRAPLAVVVGPFVSFAGVVGCRIFYAGTFTVNSILGEARFVGTFYLGIVIFGLVFAYRPKKSKHDGMKI